MPPDAQQLMNEGLAHASIVCSTGIAKDMVLLLIV